MIDPKLYNSLYPLPIINLYYAYKEYENEEDDEENEK